MAKFAAHVDFLLGSTSTGSDSRRGLDDWMRVPAVTNDSMHVGEELPPVTDDLSPSVIDFYRSGPAPVSESQSQVLSRILLKRNVHSSLDRLLAILESSTANDVISEELSEIIGLDDLDLVSDMLKDRVSLVRELAQYLHVRKPESNTSINPGRILSLAEARKRMEETFRENASRPLFSAMAAPPPEVLPHVYTSSSAAQGNILSQHGTKYLLPMGTTRRQAETYEEVVIPPAKAVPPRSTERLISVSELDHVAKGSFPGYKSLNRIQSIVYPTAYGSNENILICAPTGAGKTDVAMLTILRVISQHREQIKAQPPVTPEEEEKRRPKIIYVAPMKALASEIVRKLGKRLRWLSIEVRELTGDMQMTKDEIRRTQIIVTTPEKWDVVTRKPTGEGEVASKVKLLIIDEVHLLNEERGAVIETIVARTLRQVESSQSVIRIVGLSATLPNYIDVADFLSVSRQTGLFYFDSSFRPVPLEQHFIGVKGKPNSLESKKNLDSITFEKVSELVHQGHQVMVFVHARKETVKSAMGLRETALLDGILEDFRCDDHPSYDHFRRDIGTSRNKEMRQLFDDGFGIHHAGMLRSDRNMMERMFEARAIKVLCCTATLAWGVNLPAHAVVIKGTQVYDSAKGSFVDLSVLDVLQVFGRAGRPGLETSGEGYICTTDDKLTHYLDAVTSQNPIESQFEKGMVDAMNAEIALGTVSTVTEAVRWLGYTYLHVRMRKNPFFYGMPRDEPSNDPSLSGKRNHLVTQAAKLLSQAHMIDFNMQSGAFAIKDLGRLAAKYYIRYKSIEIYNKEFKARMTEADVLRVLAMSTEFDQIQVRESEIEELKLMLEQAPCTVRDGVDTSQGKVNILLQAYISQVRAEDFALVSDMGYVAQNAGRIVRALMEIAISYKWADTTAVLMGVSKAIEKQLWPFENPLKQFKLKQDVLYGLQYWADDFPVSDLAAMTAAELGVLVHLNERHGKAILDAAKQFPTVHISHELLPLGPDVLKIALHVKRAFSWHKELHGSIEPFWLWVENKESGSILQLSHLLFRQSTTVLDIAFIISVPNGEAPPSLTVRFVSDRWMGAEDEIDIPLDSLVMPIPSNSHTPRLDIPFLSLSALQDPVVEQLFSGTMHSLNAIQTQAFWSLINTQMHGLLCSPVGSGKSLLGCLLICETLNRSPDRNFALVIAPRRSILSEWVSDLSNVTTAMGFSVTIAVGDDILAPTDGKAIRLTTSAHLLATLARKNLTLPLPGLRLVVCDNLEQLLPSYELSVSLLRYATQTQETRFVGFSSSLNDPADLAAWLDISPLALHSFHPSDRDQSLAVETHTFTIPHSAALLKAMAKPAHTAISSVSDGPAIVFVPSRGQCPIIARDLITYCTLQTDSADGYLSGEVTLDAIRPYLSRLRDGQLEQFISKGVGFFHEGIQRSDRAIILELYTAGMLRVLLVPRESCWTIPVHAAVVIVMSTQYVHVGADGTQIRDYPLEELVRMQGRAVRHGGAGTFHLFCQAEDKDTYLRFLHGGLPLESQLPDSNELKQWYRQQRDIGAIRDRQEAVQALSFTFLAHRITTNPTYYKTYGLRDHSLSRFVDRLDRGEHGQGPSETEGRSNSRDAVEAI
ncbi:Sec63-domain-containing protein [Auriscalpium vulgare]|uniref:Sec63-domain-containing protein n=1 Tax=Auriscalpium vulgare TaxID=40419 RepID=A0ACB8S1A7_9AGAM|nr:Sec63-domain-containing protein [Auriscalpium vulgare]